MTHNPKGEVMNEKKRKGLAELDAMERELERRHEERMLRQLDKQLEPMADEMADEIGRLAE
jgi:hypothetical protein